MKSHWTALGIGVAIGAVLAFVMTSGAQSKGGSQNISGGGTRITGSPNAPFQAKISRS